MLTIRKALLGAAKELLVLVVLASLAQAAEYIQPRLHGGDETGTSSIPTRGPSFRIKGSVKGLYPGVTKKLRATVTNPNGYPLVVTRVEAKVSAVGPGCGAGNIKIKTWKGRARVGAHAHRRIKLVVRMKPKAPDACQGGRFALTFSGKAVRP